MSINSKKIRKSWNGIDRPDDQVVVAVLAIVEVEAAEPAHAVQKRDDLLDVDALGVVTEVDEHLRAVAELLADEQGGAPVGQIGGVEGGLVELVLDEQLEFGAKPAVDLAQRVDEPFAARPQ